MVSILFKGLSTTPFCWCVRGSTPTLRLLSRRFSASFCKVRLFCTFTQPSECCLFTGADRFLSFPLLLLAFEYLPKRYQLQDELSVLVDPRSVCTIASVYPKPRKSHQTRAYQRGMQATVFVLRASWTSVTETNPAHSSSTLQMTEINEVQTFLDTHGLMRYKNVFGKCKVPSFDPSFKNVVVKDFNQRLRLSSRPSCWMSSACRS